MQNFSQDLLASHARLCSLENELSKERDGLITNYNRGGPNSNRTLYGSYYPMLAKYTDFADKYVMELAKFKKLLEKSVQQKPSINNNNTSNNTTNNQTDIINTNDNINNNNNNNTNNNLNNNTSRKFATMNNGNYNNNDNDDGKQPDIDQQQQQQHHHQQQSQDETKLSSLYDEPQQQPPPPPPPQQQQQRVPTKPPVKSSNGVSILPPQQRIIEPQQQNQRERMITTTSHKPRNRTIKVSRHKYKYEGRGFDIWKQNLRRPIYTSTTLKIFRKFGIDKLAQHAREKLVKKWLYEKGGFKQELIEQITFIGGKGRENNDNNNQRVSDFTLVRVRASLKYIYKCIDKIDIEVGRGVVIKQNNRPKTSNNAANSKLYVTNFDILDPNTHRKLNDIFLEFGELEQDIFIGKDWKNNPYALVHFRNIKDAVRCVQSQNTKYNHKDIIFFPQITETTDNNYNDDNSSPNRKYLNRKLHIEYNRSDNQQSNGNRGRRGRGRGGRNYQSRR